jgi:hypothetical protein
MADVEALIDKRVIPARSGRPDIGSAAPPLGCLCAPRPGAPISPGRAHCACTGAACDRSDSFVVSIRREGITRSTRSSPASPLQKSAPGRVISTRRSCRTWRSEDAAAIPKFLPRIKDGDRIRSGGPRDAEARVGGEFIPKTAPSASTARENVRAPLLEGLGVSGKFRRFARTLTVHIQSSRRCRSSDNGARLCQPNFICTEPLRDGR